MRYLLDRLRTEIINGLATPKRSGPGRPRKRTLLLDGATIIDEVFQGTLLNEVTCLRCRVTSRKNDPCMDLSLDLPPDSFQPGSPPASSDDDPAGSPCSSMSSVSSCNSSDDDGSSMDEDISITMTVEARPPVKPNTIYDCLSRFVQAECLDDNEKYVCSSCGCTEAAIKKFTLDKLPKVLCLHLKRFRWIPSTKISTHIEFPFDLDVSQYTTNKSGSEGQYELFGVICHHGKGTVSGHYTSYCLNHGEWYHYNDSEVRVVSADEVAQVQAYILFYRRKEFKSARSEKKVAS